MLKRLINWFKSLFQQTPSPATASPAPTSIAVDNRATDYKQVAEAIAFLRARINPVTAYELQKRVGRGMTDAEVAYSKERGVVWPEDPKPTGPVDRSGTDLTDGAVRVFKLADDQAQTVTFSRSGVLRVIGYAGTQLLSVNGNPVFSGGYELSVKAGSFTFAVRSAGGDIAVQLV